MHQALGERLNWMAAEGSLKHPQTFCHPQAWLRVTEQDTGCLWGKTPKVSHVCAHSSVRVVGTCVCAGHEGSAKFSGYPSTEVSQSHTRAYFSLWKAYCRILTQLRDVFVKKTRHHPPSIYSEFYRAQYCLSQRTGTPGHGAKRGLQSQRESSQKHRGRRLQRTKPELHISHSCAQLGLLLAVG